MPNLDQWLQPRPDVIVFERDRLDGYVYTITALTVGGQAAFTAAEEDTSARQRGWVRSDGTVSPAAESPASFFEDVGSAIAAVSARRQHRPLRGGPTVERLRAGPVITRLRISGGETVTDTLTNLVDSYHDDDHDDASVAGVPPLGTLGDGQVTIAPELVQHLRHRVERCGCGASHAAEVEHLYLIERQMEGEGHLGEGELGVDVAAMWRMMTEQLYGSSDLVALSTREALQNAVDAIRTAYRSRGPQKLAAGTGVFEVTWETTGQQIRVKDRTDTVPAGRLIFEDNGVGMDLETLKTKFLVLGASGKGAGSEGAEVAAGGFGAAKAVILGVASKGRWEIHTRAFGAKPRQGTMKYDTYSMPARQGTRVILDDVPGHPVYSRIFGDSWLSPNERIKMTLGYSDVPDVKLVFNGEQVEPTFPRRRGAYLSKFESADRQGDLDWGYGNTVAVKGYKRETGSGSGNFYIRLNGLIQFVEGPGYGAKLGSDILIDITTTNRPDSWGYPFTASRDRFNQSSPAHSAFEELKETFAREQKSSDEEKEFDTLLPDSDDPREREGAQDFATALAEVSEDPEFKAMLADLMGAAEDFYREQGKVPDAPRDAAGAEAPGAPEGRKDLDPYARFRDWTSAMPSEGDVQTTEGRKRLGEVVGDVVAGAQGGALGIPSEIADTIDQLRAGQHIDPAAARQLLDAIESGPREKGMTDAVGSVQIELTMGMLAGLIAAAAGANPTTSVAAKAEVKAKAKQINPFGKAGVVKISRKNYDKARGRRFLKNAKKFMPHLVMWDLVLKLLAKEGKIRIPFKPGFILDATVRAMAASEGEAGSRQFVNYVMVNPDGLEATIKAHRDRPGAIAAYLHHIGAHELTHLPRMGHGHNEQYVTEREDLGIATGHLLPVIEQIVVKTLKLEPKLPEATKALVKAAEKKAKEEARTRLQDRLTAAAQATREAAQRASNAEAELARMRAIAAPVAPAFEDQALASVLSQLRDLAKYHQFRAWLASAAGSAFLPAGVSAEEVFTVLDAHPLEAVEAVRAALRRRA